jgi:HSP20 family molecular chaperone IbpA
MMFDYDSFFNWDKPAYTFSRSVHDMHPYSIKTLDDRVVLVHNIVGVKEDDIKVDIVNKDGRDQLVIEGVTHNDLLNYDYKINSRFDIKADMFKNVTYSVEDGLLYINLFKKEPEATKLIVTKA